MKFSRLCASLLIVASALTFASAAAAQEAYTKKPVNVRAGPDRNYPLVAWLPGGAIVYVNGCVEDYRWCDITSDATRGWVYAGNLEYTYQGRPVPIYGNGPTLALPIISFILGSYWNDHYRDRPWYGNQNQWNNWRPGVRPPPRPGVRPQPPRPPVVRPQPPRPPITVQPPRPPRPPVTQPSPRPQPPGSMPPGRPQPMPKPSERPPVNPPNGSLR